MSLYKWSQTAANNAMADTSVNWQEGQSPSSVNDSARAMMAAIARHRDDITGAIVTGGTATAYNVLSYEAFDTLVRLNGQIIAFTPHTTNNAVVTLNVDALGAKPLRSAPGVELLAGTLIQGTPYLALYNNADAAFYLHGFYGNPYNIPLAGGMDYWGSTAPNSSFVFPIGQAISRATYSSLFAIMGTTYGAGDGSTTFNLPDRRGRVSTQLDPTGTIITSATMTPDGNSLGGKGGAQVHTLTVGELPAHTHNNSLSDPGHIHNVFDTSNGASGSAANTVGVGSRAINSITQPSTTGISITNASVGSGNSHNNMQPTIACNYILRII